MIERDFPIESVCPWSILPWATSMIRPSMISRCSSVLKNYSSQRAGRCISALNDSLAETETSAWQVEAMVAAVAAGLVLQQQVPLLLRKKVNTFSKMRASLRAASTESAPPSSLGKNSRSWSEPGSHLKFLREVARAWLRS